MPKPKQESFNDKRLRAIEALGYNATVEEAIKNGFFTLEEIMKDLGWRQR